MADDRLTLVYDGECGFCTRSARWVERRDRRRRIAVRPNQEEGLVESLGLTRGEVDRASWAVEPGGAKFEGAAGINRVLGELGGGWAMLAWFYRLPPVRWVEDRYYRWVARRRALW